MIEIPESQNLALQITERLSGQRITGVFTATQPHKFAWYSSDPSSYALLLTGRKICYASAYGGFVAIRVEDNVHITIGDGTNLRYFAPGASVPAKYQLLITFEDASFLVFTVVMYGAILAYEGDLDNIYFQGATEKCSPLEAAFDIDYFRSLTAEVKPSLSAKAFLATEQRIPGLGNGVLQDILFRAKIHPKRRLGTLSDAEFVNLYSVVKQTIGEMTSKGGRDTEKDLYGNPGGYRTFLSRNTSDLPCPVCGGEIVKESYLGGTVYYCPGCQILK